LPDFFCMIPKITGTMLRACRVFAHLNQDQLAHRAGVSRDCLRTWEKSSDDIVPAQYGALCRVIAALEAAGAQFTETGVERAIVTAVSDGRPARSLKAEILNAGGP
jgi:DNA-binding XRE family transcriptional regulator